MFLSQACEERSLVSLRRALPLDSPRTHRDSDHSIQPVTTSSRLDRVSNEIPRLKRVAHAKRSHRDSVRDSYCAELVASDARASKGSLDAVSEVEDVLVAAVVSFRISYELRG